MKGADLVRAERESRQGDRRDQQRADDAAQHDADPAVLHDADREPQGSDRSPGLAISTFGMYFSTGAGGSIHIPITSDSTAYFITDKPSRSQLIGVVAMATPTHGPLASTFGRQLLDLGAAPAADSAAYARAMMALLVKSDTAPAQALSGTGRSALTDWFAVMAIEDYRGVAFGEPGLGWGYNMTQVQFYGLIARALARPSAVDAMNQPVIGQVVVGSQLEPGDPSYADVLNNGNDMQEYPDMASLKQLATSYLLSTHPDLIAAVKAAAQLDAGERGRLSRGERHLSLHRLGALRWPGAVCRASTARRPTRLPHRS